MNTLKPHFTYIFLTALLFLFSCNIEPYEGEEFEQEEMEEEVETNPKANNCDEALTNTATALATFSSATPSSNNYAELCSAYKESLEDQIRVCGDTDGVLQIIVDNIGDCSVLDSGNGNGSPTEARAFMTANIDGVEYNDMKPNGYLFFPGGVSVNGFFTRSDDDYLVIQGNSDYKNPTIISDADREINLKIPSALWKEGTYVLYDDLNDIFEGVCHYTFFGKTWPNNINEVEKPGEIIISKFSLEEKVVKGTFSFTYVLLNTDDNSEEGPFNVTGTFDYSLDDEFFD